MTGTRHPFSDGRIETVADERGVDELELDGALARLEEAISRDRSESEYEYSSQHNFGWEDEDPSTSTATGSGRRFERNWHCLRSLPTRPARSTAVPC
jgi:hypothetical protein